MFVATHSGGLPKHIEDLARSLVAAGAVAVAGKAVVVLKTLLPVGRPTRDSHPGAGAGENQRINACTTTGPSGEPPARDQSQCRALC